MVHGINRLKGLLAKALFVSLISILLITTVATSAEAYGKPINVPSPKENVSEPITARTAAAVSADQSASQSADPAAAAVTALIQQTQTAFDTALKGSKDILKTLPQTLERAAKATPTERLQINQELEANKNVLDDAADDIDDVTDDLSGQIKKLPLAATDPAQSALKTQLKSNVKVIEKAIESASDALELVTNDLESAQKDPSPALQATVKDHLKTIDQALDQVSTSIKEFAQKPA
jgi:uncharacterized protein YukE